MLVVVLNMPEHSSFQDMLFPMLFISKYAKSYASIMDIMRPSHLTIFFQDLERGFYNKVIIKKNTKSQNHRP